MRLFISHIHEEVGLAATIRQELSDCFGKQVEIFLAEDIQFGKNWLSEIQKALAEADVVLVLFSRVSSSRPWINIEAGYGAMAGKRVLPLCHSGFRRADLPIIYGILHGIEAADKDDVGRLLDQIAESTPARRLLVDRSEAIRRWVERISAASLLLPVGSQALDDPPCVWIVGSNSDLRSEQADVNEKFADYFAHAAIQHKFRVVFGRSGLLDP